MKDIKNLKNFLDEQVSKFNRAEFIKDDPIQIPHQFTKLQDIEIAAFFAAILAWGQRKTIVNKCNELMKLMHYSPHEFVRGYTVKDLKSLQSFKHRTFNATDLLYLVQFLKRYYSRESSLETAFLQGVTIKGRLTNFHQRVFSMDDFPERTRKHIATPERKSACKRLNMFLRWMVRQDDKGVDFGFWNKIKPSELICPIDLHVERVARKLKLIKRRAVDWETAEELTANLRTLDANDPVKYDFALFGLGISIYEEN